MPNPIQRLLALVSGKMQEYVPIQAATGGDDSGKIPALNAAGLLDQTLMPPGVTPPTATILASEAIPAGSLVNLWNNAGTINVRKADASTTGKQADGFVLAAVANGANATVFMAGQITGLAGLTAGQLYFLSTTAGGVAAAGASVAGQTYQQIGVAYSTTAIDFTPQEPIVRA